MNKFGSPCSRQTSCCYLHSYSKGSLKTYTKSHSSTSAMAARSHMCLPFDCVTEALSSWTPESLLHSRAARHPRKHTHLYHSLLWQTNQSTQLWCRRSDTHKVCGCAPFVHLITKAACNACWLQKQVACSKRRQRRKQGKKIWNMRWTKWATWPRWGQPNIRGGTDTLPFRTADWFSKQACF